VEILSDGGLGDRQLAALGAARGWRRGVGASQDTDEAGVPKIGVARVRVARDDSVVATRTVRAGGRGVDDHEVTR
jgi:hypothetical protein